MIKFISLKLKEKIKINKKQLKKMGGKAGQIVGQICFINVYTYIYQYKEFNINLSVKMGFL